MSWSHSSQTFLRFWHESSFQSHVHLSARGIVEGRDRAHSYHLLPSPGTPRNEDKGGSFSQRQEQSVLHSGPTEACSVNSVQTWHIRKQQRHFIARAAVGPQSGLQGSSSAQQLQTTPREALDSCMQHTVGRWSGFPSLTVSSPSTVLPGPLHSFLFTAQILQALQFATLPSTHQ